MSAALDIADLRAEITAPDAQAAFDILVEGLAALPGISLHPHEQGFLNSLRILRGQEYCLAAIPNAEWVLAYIRKPELRRGALTVEGVLDSFPEARLNKSGEITLRIADADTARAWVGMIAAA